MEPCRGIPYVSSSPYVRCSVLILAAEAMDRIHRLGQHRPVQAIKLVIEDSIESRIIQLQEKKSAMVDATLSADDSVSTLQTCSELLLMILSRPWVVSLQRM